MRCPVLVSSRFSFAILALVLGAAAAGADEARYEVGGDAYRAGQSVALSAPVAHDAFAAGYDVAVDGAVTADAHLAGYNVNVRAPVGGDIYALGFAISIAAPVEGDVSVAGNLVSLGTSAAVGGNLRATGSSVTLAAPIAGTAIVAAQSATLDSTIAGDFAFVGETLNFGANARIDGQLDLRGPRAFVVPASVAPPERVSFTVLENPDYAAEAGRTAEHVVRGVWPAVWATGLWWLLLLALGALFIAGTPRIVTGLETAAERRTLRHFGLGFVGFAAVLGLIPVAALTVLGLVLLPFLAVFVVVVCALAYLVGLYLAFGRLARAFVPIDSNVRRLGLLLLAIVTAGLLGMIPFLGWLITLTLLVFGFGVLTARTIGRWSRPGEVALPASANA